jgi:hypothetical protein
MKISVVPVSQLLSVIPALMPYLEESAKWSRGRAIPEDIVRFLLNGQMLLLAVHDDDSVYGHVICEVKAYPQCKMLTVQYCAGEPHHMEFVEDEMYALLDNLATQAGAAGIEFVGRPGWKKSAQSHGYKVQSVTYQKFFEVTK